MLRAIEMVCLYVRDHDKPLSFYSTISGSASNYVNVLTYYRWLTVLPRNRPRSRLDCSCHGRRRSASHAQFRHAIVSNARCPAGVDHLVGILKFDC